MVCEFHSRFVDMWPSITVDGPLGRGLETVKIAHVDNVCVVDYRNNSWSERVAIVFLQSRERDWIKTDISSGNRVVVGGR